ncbi:MAG: hypothetical protein N3A57_00515, partial [Negativicutes bacterium]|nr:hypothetical protein [Negativicutes bacterium]
MCIRDSYLPLVQAVCRLGIGTGRSLKWLLIKLRQFAGLFSRYRMDISLIYGFLDREAGEARLLCIGGARLFYEDDNGNQRVVVGQPLTDDSGLDDHLLVLPWRPGSQLLMVSVADRAFPPGYDQIVGRQFFRPVPWLVRQQLVREWHGRELGDRREYAIICGECTAGETGKKSG